VEQLREALRGVPGAMLVSLETTCSEGCGVGTTELCSVRVDKSVWDDGPTLFLSDLEAK